MMKFVFISLAFLFVLACTSNTKVQDFKDTLAFKDTASNGSNFKVLKSGKYWNELDEGNFEIITNKKDFLDTIDKNWGFNKIKDNSYFYLKVSKSETDEFFFKKDTIYGSSDDYILLENDIKTPINTITKDFDDYFSSPSFIENKIYFWGMKLSDSTKYIYKVYASELDLISKKSKHHLIFEDEIATDNKGYFPAPSLKNNKIVFQFDENQKWYFSKEFKLEK